MWRKSLNINAIECIACKAWVHKRCSGVRGALTSVKDYECGCYKGLHEVVKLGSDMIKLVQEFCYLGDAVGRSSDVQSSVTARICAGWRKFSKLSQVLCARVLSLKLKGRLYKSCIRSVMSYGSKCWVMKKVDTRRMQAAKMRMMCGKTTLHDGIPNAC